MDITLLNLEYFLAVTEEMNLTKAADRLYISPQSLSKHMQRLEEYFGAKLLIRSSPLRLTKAGEALEIRARQLLESKERICADVRAIGREESTAIQVGMVFGRSPFLFSGPLAEFSLSHPDMRILISSDSSPSIAQRVDAGKLDMGVIIMDSTLEKQYPDFETVSLYEDTMYICATEAAMEKYCDEPLDAVLRHIDEQGPEYLLGKCPTASISNRVMPNYGLLSPISSDSFSLTAALCLQGIGMTFCARTQLPEMYALCSAFPRSRLHTWPLCSSSQQVNHIALCRYAGHAFSAQAEKLWRHLIRSAGKTAFPAAFAGLPGMSE